MSATITQETSAQRGASLVGSGTLVRRVWFTMVLVPTKGWTRVGKAYGSEKSARGWLRVVSQAWHGLRTKTAQCTLRWQDGVMDERSRRTLSEKFNMEPPAAPPNIQAKPCGQNLPPT